MTFFRSSDFEAKCPLLDKNPEHFMDVLIALGQTKREVSVWQRLAPKLGQLCQLGVSDITRGRQVNTDAEVQQGYPISATLYGVARGDRQNDPSVIFNG